MNTDLTLSDLVEVAGLKRRSVQNWADLGLLDCDPMTVRHGTGVHKKFDQSAIKQVRLLTLLHDIGVDNNHKAEVARILSSDPKLRSAFEHVRALMGLTVQ